MSPRQHYPDRGIGRLAASAAAAATCAKGSDAEQEEDRAEEEGAGKPLSVCVLRHGRLRSHLGLLVAVGSGGSKEPPRPPSATGVASRDLALAPEVLL